MSPISPRVSQVMAIAYWSLDKLVSAIFNDTGFHIDEQRPACQTVLLGVL